MRLSRTTLQAGGLEGLIAELHAEAAPLDGRDLIRRRNCKSLGEMAEFAFQYKAASLGFGMAKPLGDNQPFDFILSSGQRLWRVQVKSTFRQSREGEYVFRATRAAIGGRIRRYTADVIDVVAGWVMPLDVWYIIPARAFVPRISLSVYPERGGEAGQYEAFREAWCLLACWKEGVSEKGFVVDRLCEGDDPGCDCGLKKVIARLQKQPLKRRTGKLPR